MPVNVSLIESTQQPNEKTLQFVLLSVPPIAPVLQPGDNIPQYVLPTVLLSGEDVKVQLPKQLTIYCTEPVCSADEPVFHPTYQPQT